MFSDVEIHSPEHRVLHPQLALDELVPDGQQHNVSDFQIVDYVLLPGVLQVEMALQGQDLFVVLSILVLCGTPVGDLQLQGGEDRGLETAEVVELCKVVEQNLVLLEVVLEEGGAVLTISRQSPTEFLTLSSIVNQCAVPRSHQNDFVDCLINNSNCERGHFDFDFDFTERPQCRSISFVEDY